MSAEICFWQGRTRLKQVQGALNAGRRVPVFTRSWSGGFNTTFTFDADGNQQIVQKPSGALTTAVWDYENQNTLVKLSVGSLVTMIYNADNRRIERLP